MQSALSPSVIALTSLYIIESVDSIGRDVNNMNCTFFSLWVLYNVYVYKIYAQIGSECMMVNSYRHDWKCVYCILYVYNNCKSVYT